jgi:hypothetical protein
MVENHFVVGEQVQTDFGLSGHYRHDEWVVVVAGLKEWPVQVQILVLRITSSVVTFVPEGSSNRDKVENPFAQTVELAPLFGCLIGVEQFLPCLQVSECEITYFRKTLGMDAQHVLPVVWMDVCLNILVEGSFVKKLVSKQLA